MSIRLHFAKPKKKNAVVTEMGNDDGSYQCMVSAKGCILEKLYGKIWQD